MATQRGFFDVEKGLQRLSDIGDQLEAYAAVVDFELFRRDPEVAFGYSDGAKGGRPPYDPVQMFMILMIQALHWLSDDRAEFLIDDRMPDVKTIWKLREHIRRAGSIEHLFRLTRLVRLLETAEDVGLEAPRATPVGHLEGKLWELRVRTESGIAQGIYVTATGRRVVLLYVFVKKSRKTERRALKTARERMRQMTR